MIRYLGVSLVDRRLRIQDWQPIFEKVETRLGGWRARLLSHGGRLILLKAVLAAIPIYYTWIFTMPAGVRRHHERIMRSFLWRGSQPDEARGTTLVAWSIVCRHVTQGGLGILYLQHTNMTLLAKWGRRMMQLSDLVTGMDLCWIGRRGGSRGGVTPHLCRVCGRVSRRCRGSSSRSWGTGRPFGSGLITGWGKADRIGFFLVYTHYPRIKGLWCGGLGMMLGFYLCHRRCPTSGWLS